MATPPENVERETNTQQMVIVVALLFIALVLIWFFFLRGGGGDGEELDLGIPTPTPTAAETIPGVDDEELDEDGAGGVGRGSPLETFDVFAPRDPFIPLIAAAVAGGGTGTAGDGTTGGGDTGTAGNGTTGGNGNGGNGNGGQSTGGGAVGGHTVKLMDVFTDNGEQTVQVQVDGTVHTVVEGDTFAESFQVLSIDGRCASFLFGDDEFTLCEGEEILK